MGKRFMRIAGGLLILAVLLLYLPLTAPRLLGLEIYAITSGSMAPEIPTDSVIYVEPVQPGNLVQGDVIAFCSAPGAEAVTHRVVGNDPAARTLTTKGDANAAEDLRPVDYANVIGRVRWHLPLLGRAALILETTMGKLASAAVLAVAAILYGLGTIRGKD